MRILIRNMLAVAVLLFGATSASAWTFDMTARVNPNVTGGVTSLFSLTDSSTIIVDVFFSTDTQGPSGLQSFTVGVLYDQGGLTYNGVASDNLNGGVPIYEHSSYPPNAPSTGGQPGYIMYFAGKPATTLYPIQTPFQNWGSENQPGKRQVNIPFADKAQNPSNGSASNIWIASLLFHVNQGYLPDGEIGTIDLVMNLAQGGQLFANGNSDLASTVNLGGPITLMTHVPEPTTAALIGLGILGLAVAGRRR